MKQSRKKKNEPAAAAFDYKKFTAQHWKFLRQLANQPNVAQYGRNTDDWYRASLFNNIKFMVACEVIDSGCIIRRTIETERDDGNGLTIVYGHNEYKITAKGVWLDFIHRKLAKKRKRRKIKNRP